MHLLSCSGWCVPAWVLSRHYYAAMQMQKYYDCFVHCFAVVVVLSACQDVAKWLLRCFLCVLGVAITLLCSYADVNIL